MEVFLLIVLGLVFVVPLVALTVLARRGEQSPEREADGPPMDRTDCARLNEWAKTNKWEAM